MLRFQTECRNFRGTGVKINSSWSALMGRQRAEAASELEAHWHHVLVYLLFFSSRRLFVFYFWHSPRWEYWRRAFLPLLLPCSSHWVCCSLSVRMLEFFWPVKCGSIGNPLEGQCLGTLSISLSGVPASSQCHPLPLLPERSLPNFLPRVCPIAAIDSWTALMWPRLHSQHITLPLVTLPLFPLQTDINWLD